MGRVCLDGGVTHMVINDCLLGVIAVYGGFLYENGLGWIRGLEVGV